MPFLHIIVLGYGNFAQTTRRCLESLLPIPKEVRVTLFDNGSPDDSPQLQTQFVQQYPEISSVIHSTNLGYAGGMNAAVDSNADGEWLMLVGSDTIFHPNALNIMQEAMKVVPPKIGILGPVTNSAGTAQGLTALGKTDQEVFNRWDQLYLVVEPLMRPLYRADFFCVAIRKSLWDALGGLDLSYGLGYYEDFDFCMRAQAQGTTCVMVDNALVFHQGSASFSQDPRQKQLLKTNKRKFVEKFPRAELRHTRLDQFKTLQQILASRIDAREAPSSSIQSLRDQLISLRFETLQKDQPKSPLKKWFWRRKIQRLERQLKASNLIH